MTQYRLAPEWARQDAVVLVWPSSHSDWAKEQHVDQLAKVERTYAELTRYISQHQQAILITHDDKHQAHVVKQLSETKANLDNLRYFNIATNDTWVRDYGPISIQDDTSQECKLLDFTFDAWGKKYAYDKDNAFTKTFAQLMQIDSLYQNIDFVLEAGNIEINQNGRLLTSSSCFKRSSSNNKQDKISLETLFRNWFACEDVFWIDHLALEGDDTGGHIDNFVRYCSDDIVAYSSFGHKSDANNSVLTSLKEQLEKYKSKFESIPLPMPDPIFFNNAQLPSSYTNFLITNEYVLVPVFNDKRDAKALKTIDDCFPSREIIDIDSRTLIQQFGGIHCATMQIPQKCLSEAN